ncbi:MucR family transcriptional regulator [Methylobacterium durans]|uniref:MucR family transcriptional regulator n=1 Tax=Methylobacterium durans TaxID=2202825 RepID=UPI001F18FFF6|nr:MucR family transcriptional regulator [Methylobacterium durans]
MSDTKADERSEIDLTAEIVSAFVSNNSVPAAELPALLASVHGTLKGLARGTSQASADEVEKPTPAQIRKSVTPDALISFIDGKPYKALKRHLTRHGLDPYSYRQRYGLPADYPMVAASYAAQRSELARATGLGRGGARDADEEQAHTSGTRPEAAE